MNTSEPVHPFVQDLMQRAASGQLAKDIVGGIQKVERVLREGPAVLRELLGPAPPAPPPVVPNVLVTLPQWITAAKGLSAEAAVLHKDLERLGGMLDLGERENLREELAGSLWGLKDRCDRLAEKMADWERDAKRR